MLRTLVSGLAVSLALAACSKDDGPTRAPAAAPEQATRTAPAKDPAAARALIAGGATVIDVRTPEEFESGHLPGATNFPIDTLGARLGELDALVKSEKAAPIVVYCGTGRRAGKAQQELSAAGYTQVVNGGGLSELEAR